MVEIKNKKGEVIYTYDGYSLKGAVFIDVNFINADFSNLDLRFAHFEHCNLTDADFSYANLKQSYFRRCTFLRTNFKKAILIRMLLCDSILCDTADFSGADVTNLYFETYNDDAFPCFDDTNKGYNDQCPKEGSFIGYKKCYIKRIECGIITSTCYIVELEIPADARRSSSTNKKCRCDIAKVLSITNLDGTKTDETEVHSLYDYEFIYELGEIVIEPNFDNNPLNECASGIHFFMDRKDAVNY